MGKYLYITQPTKQTARYDTQEYYSMYPVDSRTVWTDESFRNVDNWTVKDSVGNSKFSIYPGIVISICGSEKIYKFVCPYNATVAEMQEYVTQDYVSDPRQYGWLDISNVEDPNKLTIEVILENETFLSDLESKIEDKLATFQGLVTYKVWQEANVTNEFSFKDGVNSETDIEKNTHAYYILQVACEVDSVQYRSDSRFVWTGDKFIYVGDNTSATLDSRLAAVENKLQWKVLPDLEIKIVTPTRIVIRNYGENAMTAHLGTTELPIQAGKSDQNMSHSESLQVGDSVTLTDGNGNIISNTISVVADN